MTYVVQNQANFQAAYAGAMAGFGFGGKYPLSSDPNAFEVFNLASANAFAFASAVDTLFGSSSEEFLSTFIFGSSVQAFQIRSPNSSLDSGDFTRLANSVIAAYQSVVDYATSQGVQFTSGNQSVTKQIRSDAASFGTINEGDPATTVCTVNITTQGTGRLLLQGWLTGNGQVHDGRIAVSLFLDGNQEQIAVESWVVADDVSRTVAIMVDLPDPGAGAHIVLMKIVIAAGAAGTQFADASSLSTLVVTEYVNP